MGDWIQGRGINGEYGYINLQTGEFSETIPGSEEETQQEIEKSKKFALKEHSTRQSKFDQNEGKWRNHSSETQKKWVNKPIIAVNPDGTFYNTYIRELAPFEQSLQIVSPEFDIITMLSGAKSARKVLDIASRKKTYTGVPHRIKSDGTFMDESFLTTNDKFNIWTSDSPDFVNQYASNGGTRFSVFGKPRKLFKLPKVKDKSAVQNWEDMPYEIVNGKIQVNPKAYTEQYSTWLTKNAGKMYRTSEYSHKLRNFTSPEPEVTTDQLFHAVPSKYQGIKFNNLMDGPTIINGKFFDIPVNEWVYKAGADVIKAPFNTTKYDLMRDDLFNIITKGLTIFGHNMINNE